ncbi:hypothetical protein HYFRA_00012833 [Hymenoscyphus fraxineus]|uniref:FAD-binding domain-containing protein n=1 Tax=Hymenoscyphus fraxineus TaxID=746836 RepID=A0A9N9L3Z8_9HELO|nr:hypothetical protein HYFRA_00012833 [Hymenoscyphus fraxineus]
MSPSIRIAISGGGLAGASLIHALLSYPQLDVHIFESQPTFREAGMAIGLARNALAALDLIGPSAAQCLERAGAVPMRGVRYMLAQGDDAGKLIDQTDDSDERRVTSIVHRAAFLKELLVDVPQDRMHAGKKLVRIDRNDDGSNLLHFTDGTTHECDILIGADGIRSFIRKFILGENDPAAFPRNTGSWAVMTLKSYAEAQASLGNDAVNIEDARECMWIGNGAYLLHNLLNTPQGPLVQFVVASYEKDAEESDRWHRTVSVDEIRKIYQDWPPHLYNAVDKLLCDQPKQPAIYLWEHPPAHTYTSGSICITGDAAHATSPWQGSGGSMSIEDTLILSTLLGRAKTTAEALAALKVYDQVRRPRTQQIVESSRDTGLIMLGLGEWTKLDLQKLRASLLRRWDFIVDFDNEMHRNEALEMMEKELIS